MARVARDALKFDPLHPSHALCQLDEIIDALCSDAVKTDVEFYEFARGLSSGTTSSEESPSK